MTGAEVRKLTDEEIKVELANLQRKLYDLRVQTTTEKVEDTSQFRKVRKDIARLQTERTNRFRAKSGSAVPAGAPSEPRPRAKSRGASKTKAGPRTGAKAKSGAKASTKSSAKPSAQASA